MRVIQLVAIADFRCLTECEDGIGQDLYALS